MNVPNPRWIAARSDEELGAVSVLRVADEIQPIAHAHVAEYGDQHTGSAVSENSYCSMRRPMEESNSSEGGAVAWFVTRRPGDRVSR